MSGTVGKGTITGETGEGLYTVDLDFGSDYVNRRIAELDLRITALDGLITTVNADATTVNNAARAAQLALDGAINVLQASAPDDVDEAQRAVTAASEAALNAQAEVGKINSELARYRLEKSQAENKKSQLQAIPIQEEKEVWCTTYTEEAAGEVSTFEINGEGRTQILIAPEAPEYNALEYGDLRHRLAMSASTAYLNAALLPGWQKWKPNYRVGVISDIDTAADTCSVTLDEALSSAQDLDINRRTFIQDVPVVYLDCNASAFEDADRVVVRFANGDWEDPTVIGFESEPRPCGRNLWVSGLRFEDGVLYHIAAKVSEELTLIDEYEWPMAANDARFNVARIDNGNAVVSFGQVPTVIGGNTYAPRLRSMKNGTSELVLPFTVSSGSPNDVSIDKSEGFLYIVNTERGIDAYSWPEGDYIGTHFKSAASGEPIESIDSNGSVIVGMQDFSGTIGQPPVMEVFAVSASDLTETWSTTITGTGLDPSWSGQSISVSDEHVAVILEGSVPGGGSGSVYTVILAVLDVTDGAILRQTQYFTWDGVSAADFFDSIALRGRVAYLSSSYASASENISNRVRAFDVLDGDPNSPDNIIESIFPTYGGGQAARTHID
jgi:hypothetical protein